ncbi:MAG TPA: PilC/PilY family type IV pilus protein [Telluria sp.]|nr:PilC/PilY family type IV pilus protein [Telluria sp.]
MKANLFNQSLALALCGGLIAMPIRATAEDIDIFTGASAGSAINPRILIVLDNTSNWSRQSQQWPDGGTQGQAEVNAIKRLLTSLDSSVNLGLMEFVTGGNANDNGGFIRYAVQPMSAANQTAFGTKLTTIYNNITSPDEKRNSNTPYGNLMYDVYNYFAGTTPYSGSATLASVADSTGYVSNYTQFKTPLSADNTCGKTFMIFIGNPNSSGPSSDDAANTAALGALGGTTTQMGLPNYTQTNVTTSTTVGKTSACYASAAAATAGLSEFAATCSSYTEGCSIGAATTPAGPISCPSGQHAYSVVRAVYTPSSSTVAPGTPVTGTAVTSSGASTGYYSSASAVDPTADHGTLTCPATTTTTSTDPGTGVSNTATTTYSCTYSVGDPVTASGTETTSASTSACYKGIGTANGYWDANTTTDFAGLSCPAHGTCTYQGAVGSSSGCTGQRVHVTVTQTATVQRQYTIIQTATPSTTNTATTTVPAHTDYTTLGYTSQCYASGPASSTGDYSTECSGTNVSCTYNNTPTSGTLDACPSGTSVYNVTGTNITLTNVATSGSTTDSNPLNADEWARFMHDKGIPVAGTTIKPSVTTYTIDVYNKQPNATQTSLLLSMARAGGGKYFLAQSEDAILAALQQIMGEILAVNSAFASTSLPVNATNRSQNENQVFIGMFRPDPDAKPRWFGNLKRYQLVKNGSAIDLGDVNGDLAVNTNTGFLTPCATSYWTSDSNTYWQGLGINPDPAGGCTSSSNSVYSDSPDGPQVEKGAVAQVLRNGNNPTATTTSPTYAVNRTLYTRSGSALATFNTTNTGLSDTVVNFTRGEDVNNEKGTGSLTTTRPSIHGDVIHSRPLPVNYGSDTGIVVYYGSNDGAFRAVQASNGKELWGFIAPEFNSRLSRLQTNTPLVNYANESGTSIAPDATTKDYFFDGSTGVYQNADNSAVWVYPTMRRGGRMIYALDVTHPTAPSLKWYAGCPNLANDDGCSTGLSGIGQTWSTPAVAFVKGYSTTEPVLVVGGGYDSCEDADTKSPSCGSTKGAKVYIFKASDGTLLASFSTERGVAADVSLMDVDNDGMPDYAYVADIGGNIYRIDFIDSPTTKAVLDKDHWRMTKVAYTHGGYRKFLFAPAVLPVMHDTTTKAYVAIGSGDREHPLGWQYPYANVTNRFYVDLDELSVHDSDEAVDLDAQQDFTSSTTCTTTGLLPSGTMKAWYMSLGTGEQVVTSALIAGGMVTFSTNTPVVDTSASCAAALGIARGYWVNLFNASGGIGVDGTCGGERSSVFVGGGLPPSPVMATAVPVDGKAVSVVIGAAQRTGGASVSISPQKIRPSISSKRKQTYSYVKGH